MTDVICVGRLRWIRKGNFLLLSISHSSNVYIYVYYYKPESSFKWKIELLTGASNGIAHFEIAQTISYLYSHLNNKRNTAVECQSTRVVIAFRYHLSPCKNIWWFLQSYICIMYVYIIKTIQVYKWEMGIEINGSVLAPNQR